MRQSKLFFILILVAFVTINGCTFNMVRYENTKEGFSLLLPKGWEITTGSYNMKVLARVPEKGSKYRTNFLLSVSDLKAVEAKLGKKLSFSEFYEINKAILLEALPGIKYNIEEGSILSGPHRGKTISFKIRLKNISLKYFIGIWLIKDRAYTISASAEAEKFDNYLPIFEKVMHSLRVR
jgi:hypothetical protein